MYFGTHYQKIDDLVGSAKTVKEAGGNLIQIFLRHPGNKRKTGLNLTTNKSDKELTVFRKYLKDNDMKVVVHSSYAHNIAREWDKFSVWIRLLEAEIRCAHFINAVGIVIHFGKQLDLTKEVAYNNMYTSLVHIHNKTIDYPVPLLLETSTGQGTEMCFRLEELAHFYKKFKKHDHLIKRFRICIDTCHIFSAGYNLKTEKAAKLYLEAFEELIGVRYVSLIHLNDSRVDCGQQKDRHEQIGKGFIGFTGLLYFFKYFKELGVPIVLETPGQGFMTEIPKLKNK